MMPKAATEKGMHPRKLTGNPKIDGLQMFLLFQGGIFSFHVSFRGCNPCLAYMLNFRGVGVMKTTLR